MYIIIRLNQEQCCQCCSTNAELHVLHTVLTPVTVANGGYFLTLFCTGIVVVNISALFARM